MISVISVSKVLFIVFLAAGVISTVAFLRRRTSIVTPDIVLRKSLASILFIITAVFALINKFLISAEDSTSYAAGTAVYGLLVVIGLCFGMLGDIWLDLKYVHKDGEKRFLNAGFLSFLIGHLFFTAFMLCYSKPSVWQYAAFAAGAVGVACFTAFTEDVLKVKYGESKLITVIYMSVLGGTLALSLERVIENGATAHNILFLVGMVFFIASDALLAGIYFGNDEKSRTSRFSIVLNHTLYYIAQYVLAVSLCFA